LIANLTEGPVGGGVFSKKSSAKKKKDNFTAGALPERAKEKPQGVKEVRHWIAKMERFPVSKENQ